MEIICPGGRYEIISLLGEGGTARVYLAKDRHLACFVAVKEVKKENLPGISSLERERETLLRLRHPRIPVVLDFFVEKDSWYLVMSLAPGQSPLVLLGQGEEGARRERMVAGWGFQLCGILDYLHHQDPPLVYGDLKPANLRIDAKNQLWLTDFGSVWRMTPEETQDTATGTVGYAAPEQYEGEQGRPCPASDIYSLGATMEELLLGERPSFMMRYILRRCLARRPEKRFHSLRRLKFLLWILAGGFAYDSGHKLW